MLAGLFANGAAGCGMFSDYTIHLELINDSSSPVEMFVSEGDLTVALDGLDNKKITIRDDTPILANTLQVSVIIDGETVTASDCQPFPEDSSAANVDVEAVWDGEDLSCDMVRGSTDGPVSDQ